MDLFFEPLKRVLRLLPRLWRPGLMSFRILPTYLVSAADQNLTSPQLLRLLDWHNSQIAATPLASYVDWAERSRMSDLFAHYPTLPQYQRLLDHYPSNGCDIHLAVCRRSSYKKLAD